MFMTLEEPLLVKKVAYREFRIAEAVQRPSQWKVLFIAREGSTRQIVNGDELLERIRSVYGDRVLVFHRCEQ